MSIHEEYGVFGVINPRPRDMGRLSYYGLYAHQHWRTEELRHRDQPSERKGVSKCQNKWQR